MSVQGWTPAKEVLEPRGMWSSIAQKRKGSVSRASFMQNQRVSPGVTRSRPGTTAIPPQTDGRVSAIFNWIAPDDSANYVLYQDDLNVKSYKQDDQSIQILFPVVTGTRAVTFADLDIWIYTAGYDEHGNGTMQCEVYDGTNVDKAFRGPVVFTDASATYGGGGQVTQGTHYLAFVYANRTGFATTPATSVTIPAAPPTSTYPTLTPPSFPVTQPPGTGTLQASYDTPSGGNPVHGSINFAGWAGTTTNHVVGVLLYVDGHYVAQQTYGGPGGIRPDVQQIHPNLLDVPYVGFNGTWDVSNLAAGQHSWYATAVLDDGRQLSLPAVNFTVSAGGTVPLEVVTGYEGSTVDVYVNVPPMPDGGGSARLYLLMTRADNQNQWYWIPTLAQSGTIGDLPVPYNTATTLHFVVNVSDEDMAASLDPANDQFNLMTQDPGGGGPFNPSFVVAYGMRMCYGVGTILYVSDINNPQQIAADRNAVTLPNQRKIGYAFPLPGSMSLFLTGDRWTSYVNDNSDIPATWAQPVGISGTLGAPTPNCVCFKTGGNYAWIVTEGGVYQFTGVYTDLPVTYMVTDQWKRVNWLASYAVQIVDLVQDKKLYVGVPMDGATDCCNFMFCVDYTNGQNYDQVDISLDKFNPQMFAALGVVKEISTDTSNLWIGPCGEGGGVGASFPFTITVTDATGATASVNCSISSAIPPPTFPTGRTSIPWLSSSVGSTPFNSGAQGATGNMIGTNWWVWNEPGPPTGSGDVTVANFSVSTTAGFAYGFDLPITAGTIPVRSVQFQPTIPIVPSSNIHMEMPTFSRPSGAFLILECSMLPWGTLVGTVFPAGGGFPPQKGAVVATQALTFTQVSIAWLSVVHRTAGSWGPVGDYYATAPDAGSTSSFSLNVVIAGTTHPITLTGAVPYANLTVPTVSVTANNEALSWGMVSFSNSQALHSGTYNPVEYTLLNIVLS
jgi:hypothetical protein